MNLIYYAHCWLEMLHDHITLGLDPELAHGEFVHLPHYQGVGTIVKDVRGFLCKLGYGNLFGSIDANDCTACITAEDRNMTSPNPKCELSTFNSYLSWRYSGMVRNKGNSPSLTIRTR